MCFRRHRSGGDRDHAGPGGSGIAENDLYIAIVVSHILVDLVVAPPHCKQGMAMGKGNKTSVRKTGCRRNQMSLGNSDIDITIRVLLLENLAHVPRAIICIAGYNFFIHSCQPDQGLVVSSIKITDKTILAVDIATNAVNSTEIATGAVFSSEIADHSIEGWDLDETLSIGGTSGGGDVRLYGTNGKANCYLGSISGYPNNGYVAVEDASDVIQAGIYVASNGTGVVVGDTKSFRMPNPLQADTDIWYACIEGP